MDGFKFKSKTSNSYDHIVSPSQVHSTPSSESSNTFTSTHKTSDISPYIVQSVRNNSMGVKFKDVTKKR